MTVDVHAHYAPRRYVEALDARWSFPLGQLGVSPNTDTPADLGARIALMDDARVTMQVLSIDGLAAYVEREFEAASLTRLGNELFADLSRSRGDRFAAFGSLPLPHIDASLREIERALGELGMAGVTMGCSIAGRSAAAEEFEPLYAELDRRAAVLFFHPVQSAVGSPLVRDLGLASALGNAFEDTVLVAHLITRRIPQRYPRIRIIVPHLGGALPMLLRRMDRQLPGRFPELGEPPSATARRLYYDTVAWGSGAALTAAASALGAERLLAASDYPILLADEPYSEAFAYIERSGLPPAAIHRILEDNARGLLSCAP